ncbi:hypothetical protein PROFUN_09703 [Planoprotostelium fungivorum]|uniref:Uncharacterized protein n=1 Tax=Planoprotostelium fungivorum TaxID=1890364 RepID=A0A2P6NER9_9EUKA|nr:hypothetical protein PROFUN_09703 [Planoprotostelium fungivorum]
MSFYLGLQVTLNSNLDVYLFKCVIRPCVRPSWKETLDPLSPHYYTKLFFSTTFRPRPVPSGEQMPGTIAEYTESRSEIDILRVSKETVTIHMEVKRGGPFKSRSKYDITIDPTAVDRSKYRAKAKGKPLNLYKAWNGVLGQQMKAEITIFHHEHEGGLVFARASGHLEKGLRESCFLSFCISPAFQADYSIRFLVLSPVITKGKITEFVFEIADLRRFARIYRDSLDNEKKLKQRRKIELKC